MYFHRADMDLDDRVLRRLKLSDLRLFHAVVQWGGMAKAAAHLHISQPAVSKAIAAIEQTLGVRLLERSPQGVRPTAYGEALLRGGIAVFDELMQSVKQIEFLADPTVGQLRVGCTEPLAAGFVPTVIGQLSRQHPRVCFHVVTGDPVTLTEQELRQRKIELAIAPTPGLSLGADIVVETLFDDRQVVMADAKSKWARRRNMRLADLVHEPWLLPPPDSIIGGSILDLFRAGGLEPPRTQMVSFSIPLHHHLLASGRFLIMLPISMAHFSKHLRLKVLDVGIPGIPRPTAIMTISKRTLSSLAELFIDGVRKLAKPLAKEKY
jgi:DNA-binding transcriptional LysR family regulator